MIFIKNIFEKKMFDIQICMRVETPSLLSWGPVVNCALSKLMFIESELRKIRRLGKRSFLDDQSCP